MAKFAGPAKQASSVAKALQGRAIRSVGTVRNYEQSLIKVADYTINELRISLRELTPDQAVEYLKARAGEVGQATLNMERQAIQAMMVHVTGRLEPGATLPVIQAEVAPKLAAQSRMYTPDQVNLIADHQSDPHALATRIAYSAGLRAHELFTLRPAEERPPDPRPVADSKFCGREGAKYTVQGKGGLIREVIIPHHLAGQLEARQLDAPRQITDRGVYYQQKYDIAGGQRWSNSFSAASKRILNWSAGAHGLRHSYAQLRMRELQSTGLSRDKALLTVSQELGHFRPEITLTYLR